MRSIRVLVAGLSVLVLITSGAARAATRHVYSYDPADAETRNAAGPLTFEFDKPLIGPLRVIDLRSTVADATADLKPVDTRSVGPEGRAMGAHSLYRIEPIDQGAALISALCPKADRAWMDFGKVGFDQPLTITVIGQATGAAAPHICHKLVYDFHGEWRLPPTGRQMRARDILSGRYPGT